MVSGLEPSQSPASEVRRSPAWRWLAGRLMTGRLPTEGATAPTAPVRGLMASPLPAADLPVTRTARRVPMSAPVAV